MPYVPELVEVEVILSVPAEEVSCEVPYIQNEAKEVEVDVIEIFPATATRVYVPEITRPRVPPVALIVKFPPTVILTLVADVPPPSKSYPMDTAG
jgi:hypothetical protein